MPADFSSRFNQALGDYTGKRSRPAASNAKITDEDAYRKRLLFEAIIKAANNGPTRSTQTSPVGEDLGAQASEDLITSNAEFKAPDPILKGDSFLDKISNLPGTVARGTGKVISATGLDDAAMFGLEQISRLPYGAFEAMKEQSESANEGQNPLESIDDVLKGAWSGFSLKERTGFGEVVEENAKREGSSIPGFSESGAATYMGPLGGIVSGLTGGSFLPQMQMGEGLNQVAETNPQLAQNLKRAQGFAGELGFDPLNAVGGKAVGMVAGGADKAKDAVRAARVFDDAAFKQATVVKAEKIAKDLHLDDALNTRTQRNAVTPTGARRFLPLDYNNLADFRATITRVIDNVSMQVQGGATAGRVVGAKALPATIADTAASELSDSYFRGFETALKKLRSDMAAGKIATGVRKFSGTQAADAFEASIIKQVEDTQSLQGLRGFNFNFEQSLQYVATSPNKDAFIDAARVAARRSVDDQFTAFRKSFFDEMHGELFNAPAFRVGTKALPMKRVGKAYANFRGKHLLSDSFKRASHSKMFMDRIALMSQRMRSLGNHKYENFLQGATRDSVELGTRKGMQNNGRLSVRGAAQKFAPSKADRKTVTNIIVRELDDATIVAEHGAEKAAKLRQAADFVQEEYKEILKDELEAGVRKSTDTEVRNYVYQFYRKLGKKTELNTFKDEIATQTVGNGNALPSTLLDGPAVKDFHLVDDAFEALALRKIKSNRNLTNSWFTDDLLDHYGVLSDTMSDSFRVQNKLVPVNKGKLSVKTRTGMDKAGKKAQYYLPSDVAESLESFKKFASSEQEMGNFLRMVDKVTRMFKFSATILYPGFHIRNGMGDMFMSYLDGVRAGDYQSLMTKVRARSNGKTAQYYIGNRNFSLDELTDIYRRNVSSGSFTATDIGAHTEAFAKLNPNRAGELLRKGSDKREDFFRMTHFIKAMQDEYPAMLKKAGTEERALYNAVQASTYRVNKYLFDYGALTPGEKNVMRRLIPFYTYQRKVIPAVMESMFLSPKNLSRTNRWLLQNDGSDDANFNHMLMPDYIREMGYLTAKDQEEPWIVHGGGLPTNAVLDATNISDPKKWASNVLSQTNPFLKSLIETAGGKSLFNEREIDSNAENIAQSFMPFWRPFIADPIKQIQGKSNKSNLEFALTSRLGPGLPVDKITESSQNAALNSLRYDLKDELKIASKQLFKDSGARIYISERNEGASFKIADKDGNLFYETDSAEDALQKAKSLVK